MNYGGDCRTGSVKYVDGVDFFLNLPLFSFLGYTVLPAVPGLVQKVLYVKDRIWIEFEILVSISERWNYGF